MAFGKAAGERLGPRGLEGGWGAGLQEARVVLRGEGWQCWGLGSLMLRSTP
jgi:hypothetical protein